MDITDSFGKFLASFNQYVFPAPIQAKSITFCHVTGEADLVLRRKLQTEMNTKKIFVSLYFGQRTSPLNSTQRFASRINYSPHLFVYIDGSNKI